LGWKKVIGKIKVLEGKLSVLSLLFGRGKISDMEGKLSILSFWEGEKRLWGR
jgi:hypothetical protein